MLHLDEAIGNKAKNLIKLRQTFQVPPFFTISAQEISHYLEKLGVTKAALKEAFLATSKERETLRKKIQHINLGTTYLARFHQDIILRSSALGEDSDEFSFAGIYESKKTTTSDYIKSLTYVIVSAYSERVYHYAKQIGLKEFPRISIILQEYVHAEYAGVSFSTTLYKGKKGTLINAVKGGAERAVVGRDVIELFTQDGSYTNTTLPKTILQQVFTLSKQIEKLFGNPQDIEWCYAHNTLYILQTRPITKHIHDEIKVWDNSNIAESYSGILLPLTISFAQYIYARVYRDVAKTSHIDQKKINQSSDVFDHLLGFFYGRIYYNMLNWYKMLTLFPGYNRNKRNLDMMISAKSKSELDSKYKHNISKKEVLTYYIHTCKRILTFNKDLKNFKQTTHAYLQTARRKDLHTLTLTQLWEEFENYNIHLLNKWSITVDNDFLAMTWFGIYKQLAKKKQLKDTALIEHITNITSVISAQQISTLQNIAKIAFSDKESITLAKKKQWHTCYHHMLKDPKISQHLHTYLETYGGRFANELKLEAPDLDTDPAYLAQLLYSYYIQPPKNATITQRYPSSLLLSFYAAKSKHYLKNREELRLLRSQAFSFTRKLFITIGKKLAQQHQIHTSQDVFYLQLEEIQQAITHRTILTQLIKKRKQEYKHYATIELDNVFITRGDELAPLKQKHPLKKSKKLTGTGCSGGHASGKVTVMKTFRLPTEPLDIVVVKHTDPGWTPLFGLCKGLIVEHGGILSHAAIISRELHLPCIIGVENATTLLRNGNTVRMDAYKGIIEVNT